MLLKDASHLLKFLEGAWPKALVSFQRGRNREWWKRENTCDHTDLWFFCSPSSPSMPTCFHRCLQSSHHTEVLQSVFTSAPFVMSTPNHICVLSLSCLRLTLIISPKIPFQISQVSSHLLLPIPSEQGLSVYLQLSSNSLCSPNWPWTYNPLVLVFQILGL